MTVSPIPLRHAAHLHGEDLTKLNELASSTVRNYKALYSTLADYLPPTVPWAEPMTSDLTYEALEAFFRDYIAKEAPSSYTLRRSNAIAAVNWLMGKGHLAWGANFAERLPQRRKVSKSPRDRRLSDDEFLKLLEIAKRSHERDYFLCLFVRFSGRRIGEVVGDKYSGIRGMTWGDVRWEEGHILWDNTKARDYGRMMPITPRLRVILEAWKAAYCSLLGVSDTNNDWLIFPALTGSGPVARGRRRVRVISPEFNMTNPARVSRELLKRAGLWQEDGDGWHILRKTFGNQRKQKASAAGRGDAWELAKLSLDHASETTTRIYVNEQEDYERYAEWAMAAEEMPYETMAKIPVLASLAQAALAVPAPETTKPAPAMETDAGEAEEVYTTDQNLAAVIPLSSRRRLRALG